MKHSLVLFTAIFFSALGYGQEAIGSGTLHGSDWLDIGIGIAAMFGTGGWLTATIPVKARNTIPLIKMALNFFGTNFWNAKNKDD